MFMKDYIKESIYLFGEELSASVSSPEKKYLQKFDDSPKILEKKYAYIPHYMVAKLLWIAKRGSTDIEPYISLL